MLSLQILLIILIHQAIICGAANNCAQYDTLGDSSYYCDTCSTSGNVRVVMSDRIICAPYDSGTNQCTVDSTYVSSAFGITFTGTTIPNTAETICYSCSELFDGACSSCSESTASTDDSMINIYDISFGCDTCATSYKRKLTYSSYMLAYKRGCTSTTTTAATACTWTQTYDSTSASCVTCSDYMNGCASCTSTSTCTSCQTDYYMATTKTQSLTSTTTCLYKSCGIQSSLYCPATDIGNTICNFETISNCKLCEYDASSTATCTLCSSGYYVNGGACTARASTASQDYYVLAYSGYSITSGDGYYEAYYTNTGTSISSPFLFIQQALSTIYEAAIGYKTYTATIYLMKGTHYFFYCVDAILPTIATRTELADVFCDNDNMQFSYPQSDNVKLTIKTLTCTDLKSLVSSAIYETKKTYCSNTAKATVYVNGPMFYFNVTKYASFENIIFDGSNSLAYYTVDDVIQIGYNMWDWPLTYCTMTDPSYIYTNITVATKTISGFALPFTCSDQEYPNSTIPRSSNLCTETSSNYQSQAKCGGEPYSSDFFTWDDTTKFYYLRRKVLFNIYSFDMINSQDTTNATQLIITDCDFKYFVREYEALIYVENNNFFHNGDTDAGMVGYLGENRGANIKISGSTFKHSRFCKGTIVYRKAPFIMNTELMNYTHMFISKYSSRIKYTNQIAIDSSTFENLNWASNATALAAYNNVFENSMNISADVPTSIMVPRFYHKGIVLNIEDFEGGVEFYDCTVQKNFIFIPQIYMHNRTAGFSYSPYPFYNATYDEYSFAVCNQGTGMVNKYLMADGYSYEEDIDQLFNKLERLSVIYINRNADRMIFAESTFKRNIGMFGGAITINSPNFQKTEKAYVVVYGNTFYNNMAYMSGNALWIRSTKSIYYMTQSCGNILIQKSTFEQNFGMKKHNGGAITLYCDLVSDSTDLDYKATSNFVSVYFLADEQVTFTDAAEDLLDSTSYYYVYVYHSAIVNCIFYENFSGNKGLAIYSRYQSQLLISNCEFYDNYPASKYYEQQFSPYYKYLTSSRNAVLFHDETLSCDNEYEYLQYCATDGYMVDMPIPDSVIKVENCAESDYCMDENVQQQVVISLCDFYDNDIGIYFNHEFGKQRAQAIFIVNAASVSIKSNTFESVSGLLSLEPIYQFYNYNEYMPEDYVEYSPAPIIRIKIFGGTAPDDVDNVDGFTYDTEIKENTFKGNRHFQVLGQKASIASSLQYYGAMIELQSNMKETNDVVATLTLEDNYFYDNIVRGPGLGLIYIRNAVITATGNIFKNNGFLSSTVLSRTPDYVTKYGFHFPYSSYSFTDAMQYGVFNIYLEKPFPSAFSNNYYKYNFAEKGSVISFQFTPRATSQYIYKQFTKESITYQFNLKYGAFHLSQLNNQVALNITSSNFSNCQAAQGGAIYNQKGGTLYCKTCIFQQTNDWKYASNKTKLAVNSYKSTKSYPITYYIDYKYLDSMQKVSLSEGYLYFENSMNGIIGTVKYLTFTLTEWQRRYPYYQYFVNCTFQSINATSGAINAKNSYIYIANNKSNSNYKIYNNTGIQGTLNLYKSKLIMDKVIADSNSQYVGGIIYTITSTINITDTTFFLNNAEDKGGLFYAKDDNIMNCTNCNIKNNTADDGSVFFGMKNTIDSGILLYNNSILYNKARSNTFGLVYTKINITSSSIIDNVAQNVTHGITAFSSQIRFKDSTINFTDSSIFKDSTIQYGFFNLNFLSNLYILNSTIQNCQGIVAAVVQLQGNSSLWAIQGTQFLNNFSERGKVILLVSASNVLFDQVTFDGNYADNIYSDQVSINIYRSVFKNSVAKYISGVNSNIMVDNTVFKDAYLATDTGVGINCKCISLTIVNSTFNNLTSKYGGAMYLQTYDTTKYSIVNTVFSNNQAIKGGAIYIDGAKEALFSNVTFVNNSAQLTPSVNEYNMGGGMYYACPPEYGINCSLYLNSTTSFINNYAADQGGGLSWINQRFISDGTLVFQNNRAVYGTNTSSYAKSIVLEFITSNDWTSPTVTNTTTNMTNSTNGTENSNMTNTTNNATTNGTINGTITANSTNNTSIAPRSSQRMLLDYSNDYPLNWTVVSGTKFEFKVYLYDQDGELMAAEREAKAYMQVAESTYITTSLTGFQAQCRSGMFNFNNVVLIAKPRITVTLELNIIDVQSYGNALDFLDKPYQIAVTLRPCAVGEKYTSEYECIKCPIGSYNYEAPENVLDCTDCDIHATCYGGYTVAPKPGYWRSKNTSEDILACPREESCLGGDQDNVLGICSEGYEGILCTQCQPGYLKKGKYECSSCPSKSTQILQLAFIIFVGIFIMWIFVITTIQSVKEEKPLLCVYFKLMVSHLQMISIILTIDYDWPDALSEFIQSQSDAAGFTSFGFSTECLFSEFVTSSNETITVNNVTVSVGSSIDTSDGNNFYYKMLFYAALPLFLILCGVIFWSLRDLIKRTFKDFKIEMITTIVILVFFVHPSISKMMFSAFNCQVIDDEERLVSDFSQQCFIDRHLRWSMGLALPYLIFWIAVVPGFALIIILKIRKQFQAMEEKDRKSRSDKQIQKRLRLLWGFLIYGYELKTYYWEIVILYRKVLLIIISTYIQSISNETAALLGCLVLVVNVIMQVVIKPYNSNTLNTMEQYSLLICILTMYSGIFQISAYEFAGLNGMQYVFIIIIIIPNLVFYPYWLWCAYIEILKFCIRGERYILFKIFTFGLWGRERFRSRYLPDNSEDGDLDDDDVSHDEGRGEAYLVKEGKGETKDSQTKTVNDLLTTAFNINKQKGENIEDDFDDIKEEKKSQVNITPMPNSMMMSKSGMYAKRPAKNIMPRIYFNQENEPKENITDMIGPEEVILGGLQEESKDQSSSLQERVLPLHALYKMEDNLMKEEEKAQKEVKLDFRGMDKSQERQRNIFANKKGDKNDKSGAKTKQGPKQDLTQTQNKTKSQMGNKGKKPKKTRGKDRKGKANDSIGNYDVQDEMERDFDTFDSDFFTNRKIFDEEIKKEEEEKKFNQSRKVNETKTNKSRSILSGTLGVSGLKRIKNFNELPQDQDDTETKRALADGTGYTIPDQINAAELFR